MAAIVFVWQGKSFLCQECSFRAGGGWVREMHKTSYIINRVLRNKRSKQLDSPEEGVQETKPYGPFRFVSFRFVIVYGLFTSCSIVQSFVPLTGAEHLACVHIHPTTLVR